MEIESWAGDSSISRAEELLPNIDRILTANRATKGDLTSIVVSTGPGSYTGIRVGLATAFGLRAALEVPCFGLTSLEALSLLGPENVTVMTAVPMGRGQICSQSFFGQGPISKPKVSSELEFLGSIPMNNVILIVHGDLFPNLSQLSEHSISVIDAGPAIASYLCRAIGSRSATTDLSPLFVERNSV